jgi:GT2 family glycosyltransferase
MKNTSVNIIIVNYNCYQETIACLNCLFESTVTNFQVFIVDNNSSDNSVQSILKWGSLHQINHITSSELINQKISNDFLKLNSKVVLVENPENNGFSAGNNIVIDYLINKKSNNDEYVWLLNPDTEVQKQVLSDLINEALKSKKLILGNLIVDINNPSRVMFYGGFQIKKITHGVTRIIEEKNIKYLDAITGASLFTNIDTFKEIGLLPQDYFMYWEETDFCTKAKQKGYTFSVNMKSIIYDHGGSNANSSFLREYLYLINGLKFYKKYYIFYLPTILMSTIAKYIKALVFEDKVKQKAVFYAHIDFFKFLSGKKVDVLKRINSQK